MSTARLWLAAAVGAALALPGGLGARAQGADARARDATDLFAEFCILTAGARDKAVAVLGRGNAVASRSPDRQLAGMQGGRPGGVGWAVRSPHGARLGSPASPPPRFRLGAFQEPCSQPL